MLRELFVEAAAASREQAATAAEGEHTNTFFHARCKFLLSLLPTGQTLAALVFAMLEPLVSSVFHEAWNGMGWRGMEWDGMKWNGMG